MATIDVKVICLFIAVAVFVISNVEAESVPPTGADNSLISDLEKKLQDSYNTVVETGKKAIEATKEKIGTAYDTLKEKAKDLYKDDNVEVEKTHQH